MGRGAKSEEEARNVQFPAKLTRAEMKEFDAYLLERRKVSAENRHFSRADLLISMVRYCSGKIF
jgi:hypothetical protein